MQLIAVLDDQGCNTTEAQKLKIKPAVSACKYLPGACYFLPDSTLFWEAVLLAEGCALLTALHLASASRCPSTLSRGILAGWHQTAPFEAVCCELGRGWSPLTSLVPPSARGQQGCGVLLLQNHPHPLPSEVPTGVDSAAQPVPGLACGLNNKVYKYLPCNQAQRNKTKAAAR